jgi:hypothetical protein
MAMPMDAAFAEHNTDRARTASSFLFGGTPYRGALTYSPKQHDNPDASPSTTTSGRRDKHPDHDASVVRRPGSS